MTSEKDPLVNERSGTVREVGNHAIWSLSSCKPVVEPFVVRLRRPPPHLFLHNNSSVHHTAVIMQNSSVTYTAGISQNAAVFQFEQCVKANIVIRGIPTWSSRVAMHLWLTLGFGIDQLRDDCMDTYWQSDGQLPHLVNIQFQRKTMVSHIYIYTDYKLDESYTPSRISIRAGTHFNDLQEIEVIELIEPSGWEMIPIKDIYDIPIRTYMIQIAVLSNHQNGRDTHMRQIKIHSPCEPTSFDMNKFRNFSTVQFQQYATIR